MISLRWLYFLAAMLAASVDPGRALPPGVTERAEFVGEYRGVRHTAEHAYGYTFELWRVSGKPVGLWARVEGFPDSFLTARVADLELGPQGMVSFSATFCDLKESFAGALSDQNLKGTVTLTGRKGVFDSKIVALIKDESPSIAASLPVAEWNFLIEGRIRRGAPNCSPLQTGK